MGLTINGQSAGSSVTASQITDAGTTGIALVQASTAAAGRTALALESTPLGTPGDWTLDSGASIASSTLTCTVPGASVAVTGSMAHGFRARGLEVVGRLAIGTPGAAPAHTWLSLGLRNAGATRRVHVQLRGDGHLELAKNDGGSWTFASAVTADAAGTWVRIIYRDDGSIDAFYATGSQPTSEDGWTAMGSLTGLTGTWARDLFGSLGTDGSGASSSGSLTGIRLRGWPV